jgi:hypothetical protein
MSINIAACRHRIRRPQNQWYLDHQLTPKLHQWMRRELKDKWDPTHGEVSPEALLRFLIVFGYDVDVSPPAKDWRNPWARVRRASVDGELKPQAAAAAAAAPPSTPPSGVAAAAAAAAQAQAVTRAGEYARIDGHAEMMPHAVALLPGTVAAQTAAQTTSAPVLPAGADLDKLIREVGDISAIEDNAAAASTTVELHGTSSNLPGAVQESSSSLSAHEQAGESESSSDVLEQLVAADREREEAERAERVAATEVAGAMPAGINGEQQQP